MYCVYFEIKLFLFLTHATYTMKPNAMQLMQHTKKQHMQCKIMPHAIQHMKCNPHEPYCMGCTLHGLHTAWVAHCMGCTLHGLHIVWVAHCMGSILHGLHIAWVACYRDGSAWVACYRGCSAWVALHVLHIAWVALIVGLWVFCLGGGGRRGNPIETRPSNYKPQFIIMVINADCRMTKS